MKKIFTKVFIDKKLPFIELRYSNSNTHYKKHFHSTFSIGINKSGVSTYSNSGKIYTLEKNMLSIINPNAVHSCNSCSESLNEYYMMYLDKDWCRDIQKSINEKVENFIHVSEHILKDEKVYLEFINLCEQLFSEVSYLNKKDELIDFLIKFFSLFIEEDTHEVRNDKFDKMITYLNQNYKDNISLDELSNEFELNPFYIIRLFKSQMNLTPRAYLINVKINKAKELLKEGSSIVDTALECGFFDQSHFHKNFLKIVATTPNEYRLNFVQ